MAKSQKAKKKTKISFTKIIVPVAITAVMSYTIAAFVLQFMGQMEISSTLTTAYFSFWGVEIISLATIKVTKVKNIPSSDEGSEEI